VQYRSAVVVSDQKAAVAARKRVLVLVLLLLLVLCVCSWFVLVRVFVHPHQEFHHVHAPLSASQVQYALSESVAGVHGRVVGRVFGRDPGEGRQIPPADGREELDVLVGLDAVRGRLQKVDAVLRIVLLDANRVQNGDVPLVQESFPVVRGRDGDDDRGAGGC